MIDEENPPPVSGYIIGQLLDSLSIDELRETIGALQAEIERLERTLEEKTARMEAADALFGGKRDE